MNLSDLYKPFPPERISWRLGSTNADKSKGMALAYIDARDVMQRLDEVAGCLWQADYISMSNGTCCCRIGIKVGEDWIWRANGALNLSDSDKIDAKEMAEKASYSDAFKRAAVLWGIGRYLYDLDSPWVKIEPAGRSYKIAQFEYPRLQKLLGVTKTYIPDMSQKTENSLPPEDENQDQPQDLWPVMIPGSAEPYTRVATAEIWVMELNDMAGKIMHSARLSEAEKNDKLTGLRNANQNGIELLCEELRNGLSF